MKVSLFAFHVMFYGALVVAAAGLAWAVKQRRWIGAVPVVVGLAIAVALWKGSTDVVLVRDDGPDAHEPTASRMEYLFTGVGDVPLAPGEKEGRTFVVEPTWVVNESRFTVRIQTIEYRTRNSFDYGGGHAFEVPPGTRAAESSIDLIGPEDEPPSEVTNDVGLEHDSRTWLTWEYSFAHH